MTSFRNTFQRINSKVILATSSPIEARLQFPLELFNFEVVQCPQESPACRSTRNGFRENWIIKRLGMAIGGFQYDQLRASLERLSAVAYQNTAFYKPVTQQHERVTFHFFSTFLPTCGRGGPVAADRAWKIDWSTSFFRMSQATGVLFDLDVYRKLTPASRRLFLVIYEPLRTIGVDEAAIRRLFKQHARGLIQRWIRITDTAMHEKPRGFPGFKVSPPSFLIDGIQNNRLPPDWIYAHDKQREREEFERKRAAAASNEESLRAMYTTEKAAALREYLQTPEGQKHYSELYIQFLEFYRQVEPDRPYEAATHRPGTGSFFPRTEGVTDRALR